MVSGSTGSPSDQSNHPTRGAILFLAWKIGVSSIFEGNGGKLELTPILL